MADGVLALGNQVPRRQRPKSQAHASSLTRRSAIVSTARVRRRLLKLLCQSTSGSRLFQPQRYPVDVKGRRATEWRSPRPFSASANLMWHQATSGVAVCVCKAQNWRPGAGTFK